MAAFLAGGGENRVRRLNALRFFKLPQVIPRRQKNNPLRIDDNNAPDVRVVGQQNRALIGSQGVIADGLDGGAFTQVLFQPPAAREGRGSCSGRPSPDAHDRFMSALPVDNFLRAKLVDLPRRFIENRVRNDDRATRDKADSRGFAPPPE